MTPDIVVLRATGPMVAWVEVQRPIGARVIPTLVVARGATGEILLRVALDALPSQIGLAADGTVVLSVQGDLSCSLRIVSPATPTLRRIQLPFAGGLCPSPTIALRGQSTIAVAGGRIVYRALSGYGVTDPQGATHALGDASSRPTIAAGIASTDERSSPSARVATAIACSPSTPTSRPAAGHLRGSRRRPRASSSASGPGGCGSHATGTCASACGAGPAAWRRCGSSSSAAGIWSGSSAASALPTAGAAAVVRRVRIARYAQALAGCPDGLRVQAVLQAFNEHSRGLGSYRVRSHARCLRRGGPSFTEAREPHP